MYGTVMMLCFLILYAGLHWYLGCVLFNIPASSSYLGGCHLLKLGDDVNDVQCIILNDSFMIISQFCVIYSQNKILVKQ